MEDELVRRVGDSLVSRGWRLAVVETAAGGGISRRLVGEPGASAWFWGGVVAYSNASKSILLGEDPEALSMYGAVSRQTTEEMAFNLWRDHGVEVVVAESSIAYKRPGARSQKPAGLSFIAVCIEGKSLTCEEYMLRGDRREIMEKLVDVSMRDLGSALGLA